MHTWHGPNGIPFVQSCLEVLPVTELYTGAERTLCFCRLSGKANRHNVRILGTENSHEILEHGRDSPKLNFFVLYEVSSVKVFFFAEPTAISISYLDTRENHFMPQLKKEFSFHFIFQLDGVPSHLLREVTSYFNRMVVAWIGRGETIA
jgi:hypothetical protein